MIMSNDNLLIKEGAKVCRLATHRSWAHISQSFNVFIKFLNGIEKLI